MDIGRSGSARDGCRQGSSSPSSVRTGNCSPSLPQKHQSGESSGLSNSSRTGLSFTGDHERLSGSGYSHSTFPVCCVKSGHSSSHSTGTIKVSLPRFLLTPPIRRDARNTAYHPPSPVSIRSAWPAFWISAFLPICRIVRIGLEGLLS